MAFFLVLSALLLIAALAPRFGADSRDLARRGNRLQFPLSSTQEQLPAR
jgi:hypothetical protein